MRNLRRVSIVAMFVAVAAISTTNARGYVSENDKWPTGTNIIMQLQLGASPSLQDGAASWGQVFEAAATVWNTYLSNVRLSVVQNSNAAKAAPNGLNNTFFESTVYGDAFGARTLAVTARYFRGTVTVEADIVFNTAFTWNSYRGRLQSPTDFRRVAIHELGHLLGLDHPDQSGQTVTAIMNATVSDLDTVAADDIAGVQARYGAGVTSNRSFPPRNEPNDFYNQLIVLYRDFLGAALSGTFVDPEGVVIWLTEYARQVVGQCDHAAAVARTLAQIVGSGGTLVCGLTPAGPTPFPARNIALDFMNQLNSTYQTVLGRPLGSSYVNNEGSVVWVLEYLRYRLNGCGHGDAVTKVFQQIRGLGIQPVCIA